MTDYLSPPPTRVKAECSPIYDSLKSEPLSVLCGRNNSGKTFLLRQLANDLGEGASYLGAARLQNFNALSPYDPIENRRQRKWNTLHKLLRSTGQNTDNSPFNLAQAIAELSDIQRATLFDLVDTLLGTSTAISYTAPDNIMSQKYVSVDGYNLSFTSSGFRLVTTLLTSFLDKDYSFFLVDEPELGLSPEIQGRFSDFLLDPSNRSKHFPHMTSAILATHSPIFLDRKTLTNNYIVGRDGEEITIRQLQTVQDLNSLQFSLLGNRFETLFLPSAIMLVEGATDHKYLSRLLALQYPASLLSIIHCSGDGRIREVLAIARQMLTDIRRSPYADRIFVILDAVHGPSLVNKVEQMGVRRSNIIVWDGNGIEHVFPREILEQHFGSYEELDIRDDVVSANGIEVRKQELADYVVDRLTRETDPPNEVRRKLLDPLDSILY